MNEDQPSAPGDAPSQDAPSQGAPPAEEEADRKPLEQREDRREKRSKNTLILRELALIAALGLVILAFRLNWGNPEGNRNVAARKTNDIRLRDVRVPPPPKKPKPKPKPKRKHQPKPKPKVPKNVERKEVPDEEVKEDPEVAEKPTTEPIESIDTSPVQQQTAEPAPEPAPKPAPKPKPKPPTNKVFNKGTADRNAQMKGAIKLKYPRRAKQANIEGRVILQFVVDESGRPQDIQVLRSPNDMLSEAAVAALQKKSFTPAMQGGKPVKMRMSQPVTFRLK